MSNTNANATVVEAYWGRRRENTTNKWPYKQTFVDMDACDAWIASMESSCPDFDLGIVEERRIKRVPEPKPMIYPQASLIKTAGYDAWVITVWVDDLSLIGHYMLQFVTEEENMQGKCIPVEVTTAKNYNRQLLVAAKSTRKYTEARDIVASIIKDKLFPNDKFIL